MTEKKVPPRSDIPREYTWNAESVFESAAAWEAAFNNITERLPGLEKYKGHLAEGSGVLADAVEAIDNLFRDAFIVFIYAGMSSRVDLTNQEAAAMFGRAQGLAGQVFAGAAFLNPELLAIGEDTLRKWMGSEPRLAIYDHYISDLFRKQAHVRSAEVEEVLGMLSDPFFSTSVTADMLADADLKFPPAIASDGTEVEVTQGTMDKILNSPDREARRTAWESYADTYLAFKNTLTNNLVTSIKQNVFLSRARRYESSLEAALFENNVPLEVFHTLIGIFQKNLPTWHRYWRIRRKALGVDTLHPYDIWAPLTDAQPTIPYEQAVEWICEGLAPLGEDYVGAIRKGCLQERWVDVYPNIGKAAGAFSWGTMGTSPFILMSYADNVSSLSTLAHELGHSMHSYLTWQSQPYVYSNYSLFVAEVASNFHQAMVRACLLENNPDAKFQINVIEEAMDNFHRYFFIMPTLARFELEMHERIEQGKGVSADDTLALMADLFEEGYGGEMHVDRERVGITWAQFPHLYVDYYVYQYAIGISGANAIANRILSGVEGAAEAHRQFLSAGASKYPADAVKLAGVDLTRPGPIEEAFAVLTGLVDRLEKLTG
jgi:oligoendopeptidase F